MLARDARALTVQAQTTNNFDTQTMKPLVAATHRYPLLLRLLLLLLLLVSRLLSQASEIDFQPLDDDFVVK